MAKHTRLNDIQVHAIKRELVNETEPMTEHPDIIRLRRRMRRITLVLCVMWIVLLIGSGYLFPGTSIGPLAAGGFAAAMTAFLITFAGLHQCSQCPECSRYTFRRIGETRGAKEWFACPDCNIEFESDLNDCPD